MSKDSTRHEKSNDVGWDVVRLHYEVRVVIVMVSPATDLNVELATVLLRANTVPAHHRQNGRRFEMGSLAHPETIRAVSEAARESRLCRSPFSRATRDAQMQGSVFLRPK